MVRSLFLASSNSSPFKALIIVGQSHCNRIWRKNGYIPRAVYARVSIFSRALDEIEISLQFSLNTRKLYSKENET
jgi:hypothetical protein